MIRSILVGLDGSTFSGSAIALAIQFARQFDAMVVGLGVVDEPRIRQGDFVPLGASAYKERADNIRLAQATRKVDQILEQFSLRCSEAGVASKVLEDVGAPHEQIVREAQRYDIIVLGQQTYFHFATQETPCETLKTLVKNSPRPVVTVPEKLSEGKAILIAYDGSIQAARALQTFQAIAYNGVAPIHVISVAAEHVEACRHLDHAREFLAFHDIQSTPHPIVSSAAVAQALLQHIGPLDIGLVVMGAYGQPTLREFFFGSVTQTFLKECPVPLFLYH